MTRPFWEDEVHHNEPILTSADMRQLQQHSMYLNQFQPLFDFWTRKAFWFPLLGVNERAMRVPALAYGVALVVLVYVLGVVSFASRTNLRWAALLAFLAALWMVDNPTQVHYSAEARHYSLIAFASALWCGLLFLHHGRPRLLFAAATVLFANTHFFSLPLIAYGYALQFLWDVRQRQFRWIPFHLLVCLGVLACTLWINIGPLEYLIHHPPAARGATSGLLGSLVGIPTLRAAFAVWLDYWTFLALPSMTWAVWLMMTTAASIKRDSRWVPFLSAVFVGLPLFFLYTRLRSNYPYRLPYFSPFLGLGFVWLAGAVGVGLDTWAWLARPLSPRRRTLAAGVGFALAGLALGLPAFAKRVVTERGSIHRVERNFSPYFLAYSEIAREEKPVLVLHNHCWADDIPTMYLKQIIGHDEVFRATEDALGCQTPIPLARERLSTFLKDYGPQGALVVLDQKEEDCRDRFVPPIAFPGSVEKVHSVSNCMWKVRGARSVQDLAVVAAAVGFRAGPSFF